MFPTSAPYPFHVLFLSKGRYEVASDDGRYSREFPNRKEAEIFCGALNFKGATEAQALEAVEAHRGACKRRSEIARNRNQLRKDMGLSRNRDGSWE